MKYVRFLESIVSQTYLEIASISKKCSLNFYCTKFSFASLNFLTGSGNTSAPSTGILVDQYNHIHQGASQLANGCGRYPDSCPAECSTTDNNGCPLCTCAAPSSKFDQ